MYIGNSTSEVLRLQTAVTPPIRVMLRVEPQKEPIKMGFVTLLRLQHPESLCRAYPPPIQTNSNQFKPINSLFPASLSLAPHFTRLPNSVGERQRASVILLTPNFSWVHKPPTANSTVSTVYRGSPTPVT